MKSPKMPMKGAKKCMANGGAMAPAVVSKGPAQMAPPAQRPTFAPPAGGYKAPAAIPPRPTAPTGAGPAGFGAKIGQAAGAFKAGMGDRPTPRLDAMRARMQERQAARAARPARPGMGGPGGPMAGRIPAQQNPGMKQPGGYMANGGKAKPKARGR